MLILSKVRNGAFGSLAVNLCREKGVVRRGEDSTNGKKGRMKYNRAARTFFHRLTNRQAVMTGKKLHRFCVGLANNRRGRRGGGEFFNA